MIRISDVSYQAAKIQQTSQCLSITELLAFVSNAVLNACLDTRSCILCWLAEGQSLFMEGVRDTMEEEATCSPDSHMILFFCGSSLYAKELLTLRLVP